MNQLVFIENGQAVTDSLTVAEVFSKRHSDVIRDIEVQVNKLNEAGEQEFGKRNFAECDYTNVSATGINKNRKYKKYLLTEEAFTIVAMSYVTPEAMKFKVQFIQEFKRMREQLKPKTQLQILQGTINQLVDQERRLSNVETRLVETEKKQDNINEILSLNPTEWRKKTTNLLNKIAKERGGFEAFKDVRIESYQLLEDRARCNLSIRLTNKKQKAALEGMPKSKIDKLNKMDAIADDARLTEIYLAVVKEMAVRYKVPA